MKIREVNGKELNYLWEFEIENRKFDKKVLGEKFSAFYLSDINEKERRKWLIELKKSFKDKKTKIFVVEEKGKLIGYAWAYIYYLDYLNPKKKVGYITEFFLTEKVRGKGISTKLMKNILRWFKKQKIKFVSLCVFGKNKQATAVYQKFGFEPFSIYMRKKL